MLTNYRLRMTVVVPAGQGRVLYRSKAEARAGELGRQQRSAYSDAHRSLPAETTDSLCLLFLVYLLSLRHVAVSQRFRALVTALQAGYSCTLIRSTPCNAAPRAC